MQINLFSHIYSKIKFLLQFQLNRREDGLQRLWGLVELSHGASCSTSSPHRCRSTNVKDIFPKVFLQHADDSLCMCVFAVVWVAFPLDGQLKRIFLSGSLCKSMGLARSFPWDSWATGSCNIAIDLPAVSGEISESLQLLFCPQALRLLS